jgi:DNA mismatch repair ATPase MutS
MGGKSSLLRTAGVAVVLAQMGCHVPCAQLIFGGAPVDRIFSRMGSPDSLFLRKSTFFLEMEEALRVTRYATARSLVLIDELGRGTDSREGEALASAILQYVTEGKNGPPPLLLSATHSLEVVTCL